MNSIGMHEITNLTVVPAFQNNIHIILAKYRIVKYLHACLMKIRNILYF